MTPDRVIIAVRAGIIPGQSDPALERRYSIDADEWESAPDQMALLAERIGAAQGYAELLMLQPERLNWVHVEWLWL